MAATIYEVARRAQVSISTVSLALNSPERLRESTLKRVLDAADELGFVPKAEAVTRARRGVGRIGVVAPFTSYTSFHRRLNGVLRALADKPAEAVLYDHASAAVDSPRLASLPLTHRLDGLIVMALPLEDATVDRIVTQGLPTVLVETAHPRLSGVSIDNGAGGELAAAHLLDRGHRSFAYLQELKMLPNLTLPPEDRLTGFRERLGTAGVALPDERVVRVEADAETAAVAATRLLTGDDPPTAVFAHSDTLAAGVLRAAHRLGRAVPGDLSIIGFDDETLAEHIGLTTIRQPLEESGEVALNTIMDEIATPTRPKQHITLRVSLVQRDTT